MRRNFAKFSSETKVLNLFAEIREFRPISLTKFLYAFSRSFILLVEVINQKRVRVFDRGIQTPRNRWNLEEDERIISLCTLYTCGWLLHLYDLRIGEGATDQILLCAFNRSDVAVKKKSSVPCGDIFVASFANRQNYWHSRAAKHLKRHCLHRNLCWDFCQTSSLRNLIHRTAEVK